MKLVSGFTSGEGLSYIIFNTLVQFESLSLFPSGVWTAGPIDLTFKTTIFFISQGVGICLENVFKQAFGRNVDGFFGGIWTFSWLVYFGTPMVTLWFVSLATSLH
jgi:hypothetical protein